MHEKASTEQGYTYAQFTVHSDIYQVGLVFMQLHDASKCQMDDVPEFLETLYFERDMLKFDFAVRILARRPEYRMLSGEALQVCSMGMWELFGLFGLFEVIELI
jgi:hypothetical protein